MKWHDTCRDKSPEQRVLRQLIEALLYEKLIAFISLPIAQSQDVFFQFTLEQQDYRCRGQVGVFDRIRLVADSICRLRKDGSQANAELSTIVMSLPVSDARREQLLIELEQTIRLCHWNEQHLPIAEILRRNLGYAALESAIHEGHPYHPCFKARTGFSLEDHQQFGPEAGQSFQLVWLAVARNRVRSTLPVAEENFWQRELDKAVVLLLSHRLRQQGGDASDYTLMPMHPWQWENLKNSALVAALTNREIIHLGAAGDYYQATQSVRSVLNVSNPLRATIKLPMNLVNTSSLRTLESHGVCSAPAISQWLQAVVRTDPLFEKRYPLALLDEYAGTLYLPDTAQAAQLDGQVAAIWRESIEHYLMPDEQAVPFTALALTEADGRPFIDEWLDRYGMEPWLNRLIQVAVLPVWHLLVKHGIALEAHAQNMVLVHRDGWPQKIILRDFHESVEYVDDYLSARDYLPDFSALNPAYTNAEPNRYYWMTSIEALRELVMDTLFVFNLSEVSHLLDGYYGFAEARFWQWVNQQLQTYLDDNPALASRQAQLHFDAASINTESLLTRKLFGKAFAEFHHLVSNPFYSHQPVKSLPEYDLCE